MDRYPSPKFSFRHSTVEVLATLCEDEWLSSSSLLLAAAIFSPDCTSIRIAELDMIDDKLKG